MFTKSKNGYIYISDNHCFDKASLTINNNHKWILKIYNDNAISLVLTFPNKMNADDAIKRASEYINNYIPDMEDDEFTS